MFKVSFAPLIVEVHLIEADQTALKKKRHRISFAQTFVRPSSIPDCVAALIFVFVLALKPIFSVFFP